MVKKYKLMRVPLEAVHGFKEKKEKMQRTIKGYTGKEVKIPMTQVMKFVATNPTEIHEQTLIKFARKKKIRRVQKSLML